MKVKANLRAKYIYNLDYTPHMVEKVVAKDQDN